MGVLIVFGLGSSKSEIKFPKTTQLTFTDFDPGNTTLHLTEHYASRNGHLNVCKILLEYGACVNVATTSTKATPLHRAAYMGHEEIVSLLLANGANITAEDCDGKTPLDKANERGNDATRKVIIQAQAKLNNH